ncbi:MAG: hypothetical protein E7157_00425 [Lactobacillales bacterium]|nr:hypothetical protein [Lactobacillales bacterium]
MKKIIKKILPFYYIFIFLVLILGGILMYNIDQEQKKLLLEIEKNLNLTKIGEEKKLELKEKYKKETIIYEVKDEKVVKVDKNGNLKSVGKGSTEVTIKNSTGTKSQTITVNVGKEAIKKSSPKNKKTTTKNPQNNNKPTNNEQTTPQNNNKTTNNPQTITQNNNKPTNNQQTTPQNNNKPTNNEQTLTQNENKPTQNNNQKENNNTQIKPEQITLENKNISVTNITLNQTKGEIHLNTNIKTINLKATVYPSNATNKNITWLSSNNNIATVSNGTVTAKNAGVVTISAKTQDGNKVATATITIRKNIIVVVGASQVTRMEKYKTSYSSSKYNYNVANKTLIYVQKGGSGIDYQTNEGFNIAKQKLQEITQYGKYQTNIYIFYPLSGNTIRTYTCSEINKNNQNIVNYVKNYKNTISELRTNGYNVKGYVVSMHPVKVKQATNKYVVSNENSNSCKKTYRSNRKYYQFNKVTKNLVESLKYKYLEYEPLFIKIMDVGSDSTKNYSFKMDYNTTDGVHWNSATTNKYVDMMLNYSNDL